MKNIYDFYKLSIRERQQKLGHPIKDDLNYTYYPIKVYRWHNYGSPVGLLGILDFPVHRTSISIWEGGFRVFAMSPDDLDADLDFTPAERHLENKVRKVLARIHLQKFENYHGYLKYIQKEVGGGEITS